MNKNILKNVFLGTSILTLILAPLYQARAGVLDWFNIIKIDNTANAETSGNQQFAFADSTPDVRIKDIVNKTQTTIVNGSFLVANTPPSTSNKKVSSTTTKNLVQKIKEVLVPITAYSSTPDQTDDSPFISANGTYVYDGMVAANFLPFGTKIKIPEVFGDKIFTVEDRMNSRYWQKVDVWFPDRESALHFGVKVLKIQILES